MFFHWLFFINVFSSYVQRRKNDNYSDHKLQLVLCAYSAFKILNTQHNFLSNLCLRILSFGSALASVARLVGVSSGNWTVAGLLPSQGTCLDYGFDPCLGTCRRRSTHVSLSLPPSLPLSLKSNGKMSSWWLEKKYCLFQKIPK